MRTESKCKLCGKKFKQISTLKVHMNFPCCHKCNKEAREKNSLVKHIKTSHCQIFNVPPPQVNIDNTFKCVDCPTEFKFRKDFRHHINNEHNEIESKKEDSFLETVQKTLEKLLPKVLENILQQNQHNHPTGSSRQNIRWGLIPTNLN